MAVTSIKAFKSHIAEHTARRRRYVVTYKAIVDDVNDGPNIILDDPLTPKLFVTTFTWSTTSNDASAICVDISSPVRAASDTHQLAWIFTAEFLMDCSAISWPDNSTIPGQPEPVVIEPFFIQQTKPILEASFVSTYDKNFDADEVPRIVLIPGEKYPIQNSAGVPVLPAPERRFAQPAYRVSWLADRYDTDLETFINTTNDGLFILQTINRFNLQHEPSAGTRQLIFYKEFAAYQLLLADVQVTSETVYHNNMYRYMLEFWSGDHVHYELDRGMVEFSSVGVPSFNAHDGRGGFHTPGDYKQGVGPYRRMKNVDGTDATEPRRLNGSGQETLPTDVCWLGWDVYETSDFSGLPIPPEATGP